MPEFRERLTKHAEHIKNAGPHCTTEETTKQALILPLLDALGFSPYDPTKVKAEYGANLPGIKAADRVDYALFVDGNPVMFIEAKSFTEKITNHTGQLARYFNTTPGVSVAAVTNGIEWRFFSDQKHANIMDTTPFLIVHFGSLADTDFDKLARFRYDKFNPAGLRSFAEEQTLLDNFAAIIETCLRDPDADFVRYVAARHDTSNRVTPKQIEAYSPIVKQAVAEAISKVVVGGLSAPSPSLVIEVQSSVQTEDIDGDMVDPTNQKIITTAAERKVLSYVRAILDGKVDESELVGRDTESYYSVCYQGKNNRWLLRYSGDKAIPTITFNVPMTLERSNQTARAGLQVQSNNTIALVKPEHLMKLSSIIVDALEFCQNDENFKRKAGTIEESEATN
jgi:hypothetical protein